MQQAGMLSPYRVLDLTDGRAELATFVMAGFGADVIKVEPPQGSASRNAEPLVEGEPDGLNSLPFHTFNRGKRSVVIDLESEHGRSELFDLVATADFVFENAAPGAMDALGIGFDQLKEHRADLVYVAVSPFGQTGPYANYLATDLTLAAMGGSMSLCGQPDRRPVRITVPQTWHHAAAESALAAMVAHRRRLDTGEAQYVDVSVQTAVFWTGLNAMIASAIHGKNAERCGTELHLSTIQTPLVFACADGDVCLFPIAGNMDALAAWMVESGAATTEWVQAEDWNTYQRRLLTEDSITHSYEEFCAQLGSFLKLCTKQELFEGAIERNLTIVPVNTAADTVALEHLQAREYWDALDLPSGRTVRTAGAFVKATPTTVGWSTVAPAIGEHTGEVLGAPHTGTPHVVAEPKRRLPLEGVKVADFSWIGVGPITAKSLADHGATVVHIETDEPADRLRLVGPFTDGILGINRCQFFGSFNTSKLSLHLKMKNPTGHQIAQRLLSWCDVALDSFTAGTMDRLGLGYEAARELNPDIIMATTCLFGQYGPASRVSGYGYHAAAVSGFYEVTGWGDREPGGPWNAYTDTVAPRFLTTTLLAALDHRARTGEGQYIDQAQMESALHFLAPQLIDVQTSGHSARRNGNVNAHASPHDSYPCEGDDQWCAIAVETDTQWQNLRTVMGDPQWAQDPELSTLSGRQAQAELVDKGLSAFTSQFPPRKLMETLQAAGVPAGMVQRSSDHQEDPQLAHREFFRPLEHPEMGLVPYEGHQYRISGYNSGPRMPAPCLGEHTFEVLTDVLGIEGDELTEILVSGATG